MSTPAWRHPVALLCAAVLLASAVLRPEWLPSFYRCPALALTGLPCPGCGMSHAFIALAHGHFAEAWAHNALAFPLFAAMALMLVPAVRAAAAAHLTWRSGAAVFVLAWAWNLGRIWG